MTDKSQQITFVSHTSKPGGGELALRRYLEATQMPVRLITLEEGGVWEGFGPKLLEVDGLLGLHRALRGCELIVANSMRSAFLTSLVLPGSARLVYWVRDGLTDSAMSRSALALTKHITARRASCYLANSHWTASTVKSALRVDAEKIHVVQSVCGIGPNHVARSPRSRPSRPIRLLYLGRLAPWKAPEVAVHALGELRTMGVIATLTIVGGMHFGEEAYGAFLRGLVDAEPAARILGHVAEIDAILESHDILVHTSTKPEPFGQVLIQALAAGMPVAASSGGGPTEILDGAPTSLLYKPGDARDLAESILRLLENYEGLSAWGVKHARRYADDYAVRQTDQTLTSLKG